MKVIAQLHVGFRHGKTTTRRMYDGPCANSRNRRMSRLPQSVQLLGLLIHLPGIGGRPPDLLSGRSTTDVRFEKKSLTV
jgi:hypothetical protein